jgi:hypothetical protein
VCSFAEKCLFKCLHHCPFSTPTTLEQIYYCLNNKCFLFAILLISVWFWTGSKFLTFCVLYVIDIYFGPGQERSQELGTQYPQKNPATAVLGYAVRFLKYNSSVGPLQAEAPSTPDRISDLGTVEMSWEDHLTEV